MKKVEVVAAGNQLKALAGAALDDFVNEQLEIIKSEGIIKDFRKKVSFNHVDYGYEKQFLANFLIETLEEKFIVIRRSNSFRNDRAKTGFYDIDGICNHSSFSGDIVASIYLVPDTEMENSDFVNIRQKIKNKEYYCPATHLLTITEFMSFMEGHKYEVLNSEDNYQEQSNAISEEEIEYLGLIKDGSYYGKKGNAYERLIVAVLSNNLNLIKFRDKSLDSRNIYGKILNRILKDKNEEAEDLVRVSATNSAPPLMSGGSPKTDIIITIETMNGRKIKETLSLKNTSQKKVSCHDYPAADFVRVLDCVDSKLAEYFNYFQRSPSLSAFEESLPSGYSKQEFTIRLSENNEVFNNWVLRGMYDESNLTVPALQVSNYLLLNCNGEEAFYSMEDYIEIIDKNSKKTFGVPFGWTYPSKQRGKRIQLKLPVVV
jgi:hypothetical protein